METANYFKRNGTNPFVLMLDASKAFDCVKYINRFRILVKRDICPFILQCLLHMYTNQKMNVVWNNTMSDHCTAHNGVSQGSVLSPLLFTVYIDELLCKLKKSGDGRTIAHIYCGGFGYADDILLASPNVYDLKQTYVICQEYDKEFYIRFNPAKFQLVSFNSNASSSLVLEGTRIEI